MKIKAGYELMDVCGESVLLPMGDSGLVFNDMIRLNDTAVFLWKAFAADGAEFTIDDAVNAMLEEYDVDAATAHTDIESFIAELRKVGLIAD